MKTCWPACQAVLGVRTRKLISEVLVRQRRSAQMHAWDWCCIAVMLRCTTIYHEHFNEVHTVSFKCHCSRAKKDVRARRGCEADDEAQWGGGGRGGGGAIDVTNPTSTRLLWLMESTQGSRPYHLSLELRTTSYSRLNTAAAINAFSSCTHAKMLLRLCQQSKVCQKSQHARWMFPPLSTHSHTCTDAYETLSRGKMVSKVNGHTGVCCRYQIIRQLHASSNESDTAALLQYRQIGVRGRLPRLAPVRAGRDQRPRTRPPTPPPPPLPSAGPSVCALRHPTPALETSGQHAHSKTKAHLVGF